MVKNTDHNTDNGRLLKVCFRDPEKKRITVVVFGISWMEMTKKPFSTSHATAAIPMLIIPVLFANKTSNKR
jgi:hypothetical protein